MLKRRKVLQLHIYLRIVKNLSQTFKNVSYGCLHNICAFRTSFVGKIPNDARNFAVFRPYQTFSICHKTKTYPNICHRWENPRKLAAFLLSRMVGDHSRLMKTYILIDCVFNSVPSLKLLQFLKSGVIIKKGGHHRL